MEKGKRLQHNVQFHGERGAADAMKQEILDVVGKIPVSKTGSGFNFGDYGVADVSISMELIRDIIGEIRCQHGRDLEISILYEDTYKNDFNSLFHKLYGSSSYPHSYLPDTRNVFVSACATNFYNQCVPTGTMDMIVCFIALHWLSRSVDLKGSVISSLFLDNAARDAAGKIAAEDWQTFLTCRARELKKGARMVCSIPIHGPDFLNGNGDSSADGLLTTFNTMLGKYCEEGRITESELKRAVLKEYFRSVDEIRVPFDSITSPVLKSGLRLTRLEVKQIECQYKTEWRDKLISEGVDDRKSFANNIGETIRVWTHGTMDAALSDTRRASERDDLLDEFYDDLKEHLLLHNPETFNSEYLLAYVFVEKI